MFAFRYKAKKGTWGAIESVIYATTKESAFKKVSELGYFDIEIGEPVVPASPQEKRIYTRVDCAFKAIYQVAKTEKQEQKKLVFGMQTLTVTKNISAGGLLMQAKEYLAPGTVLKLTLDLTPEPEAAFECLARVVRVREISLDTEYEIAVYFMDLSDVERSRLSRFLFNYLKR